MAAAYLSVGAGGARKQYGSVDLMGVKSSNSPMRAMAAMWERVRGFASSPRRALVAAARRLIECLESRQSFVQRFWVDPPACLLLLVGV